MRMADEENQTRTLPTEENDGDHNDDGQCPTRPPLLYARLTPISDQKVRRRHPSFAAFPLQLLSLVEFSLMEGRSI